MKTSMPVKGEEFSLEALLDLHDDVFVRCAYKVILGRMPDPGGQQNYVSQVRQGIHKAQIVVELALSPEGRLKSVELPGLQSLIRRYRKRAPSIWRRLFRQLTRAATEPTERQLRAIDNQLYLLGQAQSAHAKQLAELLSLLQEKGLPPGSVESGSRSSEKSAIHAPPLTHLSPNLGRTFTELKAAIAIKRQKK
jgi:Domain of unknown function (DUF4214)